MDEQLQILNEQSESLDRLQDKSGVIELASEFKHQSKSKLGLLGSMPSLSLGSKSKRYAQSAPAPASIVHVSRSSSISRRDEAKEIPEKKEKKKIKQKKDRKGKDYGGIQMEMEDEDNSLDFKKEKEMEDDGIRSEDVPKGKLKAEEDDESEDLEEPEEPEEPEATTELILRSNFNPLANFTPSVATNEEGIVKIPFSIPDNLTRYRIWAVAVSGSDLYGLGDNLITARLPLLLRVSPPRFLNYGDSCDLPVVVQNLTEKVLQVKIVIRSRNAKIQGLDQLGFKVEIPSINQNGFLCQKIF